jgi:hypothetical protein
MSQEISQQCMAMRDHANEQSAAIINACSEKLLFLYLSTRLSVDLIVSTPDPFLATMLGGRNARALEAT